MKEKMSKEIESKPAAKQVYSKPTVDVIKVNIMHACSIEEGMGKCTTVYEIA